MKAPKRPPLIETKDLKKSYHISGRDIAAIQSVNLQIDTGELIAVIGPSGSGKSTLLHLLGCLDKPSEGHYIFDGHDVSTLHDDALSLIRATKIGFVFQAFNLIPQLSVYENIQLAFDYQSSSGDTKAVIHQALENVGMTHRSHHRIHELSGGEAQRAAIARALAISPLIILADEPTGNLDQENSLMILNLLKTLHEEGVTILIVTHDPVVAKHCKRVIQMKDGFIINDTAARNHSSD